MNADPNISDISEAPRVEDGILLVSPSESNISALNQVDEKGVNHRPVLMVGKHDKSNDVKAYSPLWISTPLRKPSLPVRMMAPTKSSKVVALDTFPQVDNMPEEHRGRSMNAEGTERRNLYIRKRTVSEPPTFRMRDGSKGKHTPKVNVLDVKIRLPFRPFVQKGFQLDNFDEHSIKNFLQCPVPLAYLLRMMVDDLSYESLVGGWAVRTP